MFALLLLYCYFTWHNWLQNFYSGNFSPTLTLWIMWSPLFRYTLPFLCLKNCKCTFKFLSLMDQFLGQWLEIALFQIVFFLTDFEWLRILKKTDVWQWIWMLICFFFFLVKSTYIVLVWLLTLENDFVGLQLVLFSISHSTSSMLSCKLFVSYIAEL